MANPALTAKIRPPYAPIDLRELPAQLEQGFSKAITITADFSQGTSMELEWAHKYMVWSRPSQAHNAEIDELTKYFLEFVLHRTEGLAGDPYSVTLESDQFDYESVLRPITQTFRARINFKGRAQPLPIDDD